MNIIMIIVIMIIVIMIIIIIILIDMMIIMNQLMLSLVEGEARLGYIQPLHNFSSSVCLMTSEEPICLKEVQKNKKKTTKISFFS